MKPVFFRSVAAILATVCATFVTGQVDLLSVLLFDEYGEIIPPIPPASQVSTAQEIECIKYFTCKTEPDPDNVNRQGHLKCLENLGPLEVENDMKRFQQFFDNPTFTKYEDIIEYGCQDPLIGSTSLPVFILRKRSKNVGRTPDEQKKVEKYYSCLQGLVQKCVERGEISSNDAKHLR